MDADNNVKILGIHEFQNGIKKGIYTDAKGKARLIINDSTYNTYSVHIDRRIVSSSGSIISFRGLLKEYGAESIKIEYTEYIPKFPKLDEYIVYRRKKDEKRNNLNK